MAKIGDPCRVRWDELHDGEFLPGIIHSPGVGLSDPANIIAFLPLTDSGEGKKPALGHFVPNARKNIGYPPGPEWRTPG